MEDLYPSRRSADVAVLPRVDPVVHGSWTAEAPLTLAQTQQFDALGYLVLPNLFGADALTSLQAEAVRLRDRPEELRAETVITERRSYEIRSIFDIHLQSSVMRALAGHQRLVDIAAFLLNDDVYVHQSRLNYKPGFSGREFYWHSDFETWHVEDGMPRMRALSASVLLAPNSEHNGPLMLMPGSHHRFVGCVGETPDDHYIKSLKKQEYGVPDRDSLADLAGAHGIVSATGAAGTTVLFDCNMMHGSNSNITPDQRSNVFIVYNAVSNRLQAPFGGKKPRPEFIAARGDRVQPLSRIEA